ncbi:MAG: glycosyltransferase family 39 protein [Thermoflexales bacterium]|nr:glycosyltransferase family 39 protein [Thermoflexales bacterium]
MLKTILRALRLAAGLGAIALAITAQTRIVNGIVPPEALTQYAIAVALCAAAFATTDAATFAGNRLFAPGPAGGGRRSFSVVRFAIAALAAVIAGLGVVQFLQKENGAGWSLFLVGIALYAIAFSGTPWRQLAAEEEARERAAGGWWRATLRLVWAMAPVLLLVGLALAMRLPMLNEFPFGVWFDEGAIGIFARRILNEPAFRPVCCEPSTLPAHFQYLAAASFSLFGVGQVALRLVAVGYGVITVVVSYFLFRRWFGPRLGWVAAAVWACLRYMIIWSRLGNDWLSPLPFETIIILFFDKALDTKQLRYFAWAGLAMGVSLGFYYPTRLFFGVIAVFGLVVIIAWILRRTLLARRFPGALPWRAAGLRAGQAIAVGAIGLAIGGMPVIQFAATNWAEFTGRQANISIFTKRDEPDLGKALQKQVEKHILMFNVRGDGNPRHNFPGEPMLDPIIGALAVLGLAHALTRFYRPVNALMLITFVVMLSGAIFSIDFEAPQSLRAIGVQPAIIFFAITPLALVGRTANDLLAPLWRRDRLRRYALPVLSVLTSGALALGVFVVGRYNYELYYGKQRNAFAVYADHSTAETITANEMNRLSRDYDLIVTTAYIGTPSVQFVAPDAARKAKSWSGSEPLELPSGGNRGVAILLEPRLSVAFNQLRRMFPNATFRQFVAPMGGGSEMVLEAIISPSDLRAAQGLAAFIYPGGDFKVLPARQLDLPLAALDGSAAGMGTTFGAEMRGALNVTRDGLYGFSVRGAAGAELFVDEFPVRSEPIALARGTHSVRVRIPDAAGKTELMWQPPGATMASIPGAALFKPPASASGLLARYYRSAQWEGAPAFTQIEPEINFYYHILSLPRPYSIEWIGKLYAPRAGAYVLSTESRDESFLSIDEKLIIENRSDGAPVNATLTLTQGWHDIRLRFSDRTGGTNMYLYWTPPGGKREIIPFRYLAPPMGAYPDPDAIAALPEPAPVKNAIAPIPGQGETQATAAGVVIPAPVLSLPSFQLPQIQLPQIGAIQPANPSATPVPAQPGSLPATPQGSPGSSAQPQPAVVPVLKVTPVRVVGKAGTGNGEFDTPHGIAVGNDGRVYVADTGNKRVQAFDADGKFLFEIKGGAEENFAEPYDLMFAPSGELLVLDSEAGWIYRFDASGKALGRMGGLDLRFYKPRGFGADAQGNLYIADTGRSRLVKLSPSGDFLLDVGVRGSGPLQFIEPSEVGVAPNGEIYVTDLPNRRVQRLAPDLTYIGEFAIPQAGPATGPYIAFAGDGSLLMTAPEPHKIQRYSASGNLLSDYGGFGETLGGMRLPTGISLKGSSLWVAESGNNRIQKFEFSP